MGMKKGSLFEKEKNLYKTSIFEGFHASLLVGVATFWCLEFLNVILSIGVPTKYKPRLPNHQNSRHLSRGTSALQNATKRRSTDVELKYLQLPLSWNTLQWISPGNLHEEN